MTAEREFKSSTRPLRNLIRERSHNYAARAANEEVEVVKGLVNQAFSVVNNAAALPGNFSEKRKGGVLAIGSRDASWAPIIRQIGKIGRGKADKYATYALAKADGLREYKENINGDPVTGGMAFENGWVISFSGFAPDIDEAVVLAIGIKLGFTTEQKANKLAIELENKSWKEVKVKLLQAGQNIT